MSATITQILENFRADELKRVANLVGAGKGVTRKAEVIAALSVFIRDQLPKVLKHCSEHEKLALAEAAHGDGRLDPAVFSGKHGAPCPQPEIEVSYRSTPSAYSLLMTNDRFGPRALYVAAGLEEKLRELLPKPAEAAVKTWSGDLPETHGKENRPVRVFSGESTVFHELRRVLGLAQAGKLSVTAKRAAPASACVRLIGEALTIPDLELDLPKEDRRKWYDEAGPVRAFAWGVVAQQCGWLKPTGSKLALTPKGRAMLAEAEATSFREGLRQLLLDDRFDEFNRIDHIRGQTGKGKQSLTEPSWRKYCIAQSMTEWPTEKWIAFEDAFLFMNASGNAFAVSENPWDLYFCEKQYGSLGYDYGGDPYDLERQYFRAFLMETLATLGMVDLAYVPPHSQWPELSRRWGIDELDFCGRYDGLLFVRLTRLGAYCLGIESSYKMPKSDSDGRVKVLPNFDLVFANNATPDPATTARLEIFAAPANERVWKIDRSRILSHIENGGSIGEIRREIQSLSDGEIPDTAKILLDEIEHKTNALGPGRACLLIEARDRETAALIAHDNGAAKYCHLAGERHLAVPTKNERAFRAAVKKLGYVLPQE